MTSRRAQYKVDNIIINRWSPRAMSGEKISNEQLMSLFEAARWAPSSYNNQPWRFIYAHRDTQYWDTLFNSLVDFNKSWAHNSAVLILIVSRDNFEYNNKPSRTHSFDAGSAWQNLALQGSLDGLVIHGMEGFDYDQIKKDLSIPDGYTVEAMVAVGKPGNKEQLSPELQEREFPSDRKKVEEFVFEGIFKE